MNDILIVEDEASVGELLTLCLTQLGYAVRCVGDGESAVAEAVVQPPGLILLDLMLPQMHGGEVLRAMRQAGIRAPVIVTSVLAKSVAERLVDPGDVAFVPKHAGVSALLDEVARHLPLARVR
jgi:DNA-binding response OmpR family regulator